MTELQFLIDLLLNHKLSAKTKQAVADRIGEVESKYAFQTPRSLQPAVQAPSMQKVLDEMEALNPPQPTTQAAAQALQARADVIRKAASADPFRSKPEPGRTSPRKF